MCKDILFEVNILFTYLLCFIVFLFQYFIILLCVYCIYFTVQYFASLCVYLNLYFINKYGLDQRSIVTILITVTISMLQTIKIWSIKGKSKFLILQNIPQKFKTNILPHFVINVNFHCISRVSGLQTEGEKMDVEKRKADVRRFAF